LAALQARGREDGEKHRQVELALEQARFETVHARRQYDAVDPDNRLVAGELERRWNERLKEERRLQDELTALNVAPLNGVLQASERRCSGSAPTSNAPGTRKGRP
jgi:hypothetical protein